MPGWVSFAFEVVIWGGGRILPRSVRMLVQRVWQEVWKRWIRSFLVKRRGGRGWRLGMGSAMLKASFGSPCYGVLASRYL